MTYITRIANKRILAKYFLCSLQFNYLHLKPSASRSVFSCYATYMLLASLITFIQLGLGNWKMFAFMILLPIINIMGMIKMVNESTENGQNLYCQIIKFSIH